MTKEEIIKELGIEGASQEIQDSTVYSILQVTAMRVIGIIDDLMTDDQRVEFDKIEQDNVDDVFDWVTANIVDSEKLVQATMQDYLEELKNKQP